MPLTSQKLSILLPLLTSSHHLIPGCFLHLLAHEYLLWSKVLKNLILDLQNVHAELFLQGRLELLTQIVERVEDALLREDQEELLL